MLVPLREGMLFAGQYRVRQLLAHGGMGAVYEVVHEETGRAGALKVMHSDLLEDVKIRARFHREVRIVSQMASKFIVEVVDTGIDVETAMPFLVMELLPGEDLGRRLKRCGALPPSDVLVSLHQAAEALELTHSLGIVHRDLKPANLFLVQREGEIPFVKVLDFGIAKILAEGQTSTTISLGVGTPTYMAPEQIANSAVSPATDIYALGLTAYALLTGEAYWASDMREAEDIIIFALLASDGPQEPATVRAARRGVTLPRGFDAWFARSTARKPADRFPSARTAIAELVELFEVSLPASADAPRSARLLPVPAPLLDPVTVVEGAKDTTRSPTVLPTLTSTLPPAGRPSWRAHLARYLFLDGLLARVGVVLPRSGGAPRPHASVTERPADEIVTPSGARTRPSPRRTSGAAPPSLSAPRNATPTPPLHGSDSPGEPRGLPQARAAQATKPPKP